MSPRQPDEPAPGSYAPRPQRPGLGRLLEQRLSLRRALLLLLVLALVPITAISVGQGFARLKRDGEFVSETLREGVRASAATEASSLTTTGAVLRLLTVTPSVRAGGPACSAMLARAREGFPSYANLFRVDAAGDVICSAEPSAEGTDVRDQAWWRTMLDEPRMVIADPMWGRASRRRVVQVAYPIVAERAALGGAVVVSLDVAQLQREFRQRHNLEGPVTVLLNADGRPLLTSGDGALPTFRTDAPPDSVLRADSADGRGWSYAVAPLITDPITGRTLRLAYAVPHARLFTTSWLQIGIDFGLPILAVVLTSFAIWLGTEKLVLQWITGLRRLAAEFGEGKYRSRVMRFSGAPTEIRMLAADLYRMASSVEERDAALSEGIARQRTLALEVHHRVKNNLQIVLSILSLQAMRLTDPAARVVIAQTRVRVSALALVHRLLYETGEVSSVGARRLLTEIAAQVQLATKPPADVQVQSSFEDAALPMDTAVPVTLWMVEALSNAFGHAFPPDGTGTVCLSFARDGGDARLEVADDGGGFDPAGRGGNGLRLMRSIGQQLAGRAEIGTAPGGGTRATLVFPLPVSAYGREPPRVPAH